MNPTSFAIEPPMAHVDQVEAPARWAQQVREAAAAGRRLYVRGGGSHDRLEIGRAHV